MVDRLGTVPLLHVVLVALVIVYVAGVSVTAVKAVADTGSGSSMLDVAGVDELYRVSVPDDDGDLEVFTGLGLNVSGSDWRDSGWVADVDLS